MSLSVIENVTAFLDKHNIRNKSVLIALSGGRDSMTLLNILLSLRQTFGLTLHAAYINHHIREDSDDEETFVTRTVSSAQNITLHKHIIDKNYWLTHSQSVEENARRIRYDFFQKISGTYSIDFIATAHHFDDRIETFFINILRGGGTDTLVSIPAISGNIIRPLLNVSRHEIDEYVKLNNIMYIDDFTNNNDDYLRNRIRHHLIPALSDISDHYRQSFSHIFNYLAEDIQTMEWITNQALSSVIYSDNTCNVINRNILSAYPVAVRKNVIKKVIANLNYPCKLSQPLLDSLSSNSYIRFKSGSLNAVSCSKFLFITDISAPISMPTITVTESALAETDIHKHLILKSDTGTVHVRQIIESDSLLIGNRSFPITKVLSDMHIPTSLHDRAVILSDGKETAAAVWAFGQYRVSRQFFASGNRGLIVTVRY